MHIDWNWAKQRPHFIAQKLMASNRIAVFYTYTYHRRFLIKNPHVGMKVFPIHTIPTTERFLLVKWLNDQIKRVYLSIFCKIFRSDVIWITSPILYESVKNLKKPVMVYDCMDDILAFPSNFSQAETLAKAENDLINQSSIVFCSSLNLKKKLITRYGNQVKYHVIHNAFDPDSFEQKTNISENPGVKDKYVLGYIGTISSWLDFDGLEKIVSTFNEIEIHLIGPVESSSMKLPIHERIKVSGSVNHRDLPEHIAKFDALLVPFIVNDLIQSVDPVKLYEYIFFNKPIIAIQYPEIERFSSFVYFYQDNYQLIEIIGNQIKNGFKCKYSKTDRDDFILNNTFDNRLAEI
jgi:glycosyltransferase involved in cell wall biosynthesis